MRNVLLLTALLSVFSGSVLAQINPRDIRTTRSAIREERKEDRAENREERKASMSARREEFKDRMQAVRDEKKLAVLKRIEEKLAKINERRTGHFLKVLARLREILAKIQSRSDRAEANGKNVSSVDTAIGAAETALDAAEVAVNAQADKVYELTVDDETTARNDVGGFMKKLQEDLRVIRDFVHKARTAVFDALRALTRIVGSDGGTATPSATPT